MHRLTLRQAGLLAGLWLWTALALQADTLLGTSTYNYTGGNQGYTAPTGTNYVVIKVWGAGGGSGINGSGGGGAFATATYTAAGGQTLTVIVGGAGSGFAGSSGGWPNGGGVGSSGGAQGSGGGSSRVYGGAIDVWAGAGGGGCWGYAGGAGGGPNGGGGAGSNPGGGATQGGGGAAGSWPHGGTSSTAGSHAQGGLGADNGANLGGAGGGGGYFGGGGGGEAGGGGGGSSYIGGSPTSASYAGGGGDTPGGMGDPAYPGGGIGYGGYGVYVNGYHGYVSISAYQASSAPTITSTGQQNRAQNQPAGYSITAIATPAPTSYGATNLPPGLSTNPSTGAITGNATTAGTYNSTVSATNSMGTGYGSVTWVVTAASITTNASVLPSNISEGSAVTLTRSGTANFGIAWTENVIWKPDGFAQVLGNMQLGSQSYTPAAGLGTYWYQFRLVDNYSNYQDQWISFVVSLPAPSSFQSTNVQSYAAAFSWSAVSGATGYNVYRNGTKVNSSLITGTTFTDTTAAPGTAYSYTVRSVTSTGAESGNSTAVNITTATSFEVFTPLVQ